MRYFKARQYTHASEDGLKTLCGLRCNTHGCHWETDLWEEVKEYDFKWKPCPVCLKKSKIAVPKMLTGTQMTLEKMTK